MQELFIDTTVTMDVQLYSYLVYIIKLSPQLSWPITKNVEITVEGGNIRDSPALTSDERGLILILIV